MTTLFIGLHYSSILLILKLLLFRGINNKTLDTMVWEFVLKAVMEIGFLSAKLWKRKTQICSVNWLLLRKKKKKKTPQSKSLMDWCKKKSDQRAGLGLNRRSFLSDLGSQQQLLSCKTQI